MTRAAFGRDERTQDAVVRCLEILSEASRRVPEAMKAAHPDIPWAKIAGICNILRHEYRSVSTDAIWQAIGDPLADLERAARAMRKASGRCLTPCPAWQAR
jgi:uncharacterized protein with HEPN domain